MAIRRQIRINGIVQGVGFRPFIFNLARAQGLTGFVSNTSEGVIVEVQGSTKAVVEFITAINQEAPPLALITDISTADIPIVAADEFVIIPSDGQAKVATMISPDIAVCEDCLQD
ncbi:MAG: carbamoyltransferase HypF, partial [Planctomycetes bacterium]|nr:carbamoyltransferase HypF [Planctomycetota bacterium]